jgi:hypothetical protein
MDYSDGTPDVTVTYDRLGRQVSQSNGLAKTTFTYDAATLQLDAESVSYDWNGDGIADFSRVIDCSAPL